MLSAAILTLQACNELDSFIAHSMLNRAKGLTAFLAGPDRNVVSMNGVGIEVSGTMKDACDADLVLFGSGMKTRDFANDDAFMKSLAFDPSRQLIGGQCSGVLLMAKSGLVGAGSVTTDDTTRPWVTELGISTNSRSLAVHGNVATAGGCLSSQYLATWALMRLLGEDETRKALTYVVPVGEATAYSDQLIAQARAADPNLTLSAA